MALGIPGATAALDWTDRVLGGHNDRAHVNVARWDAVGGRRAKTLKSRLHTKEAKAEVSPDPIQTHAVDASSITGIIYAAAAEFGLDGGYLLAVATCESTLNPTAYNPAGYHGLFQFDQTTWSAYGYGSIYDPVAQSRTAARLLAAGQDSRWPNCA
ncbi:MAG: transglycosylase family protein [Actinomycetota bacterium]